MHPTIGIRSTTHPAPRYRIATSLRNEHHGVASQRPFLHHDQLRADHLGCYGNRTVRTPAIDKIAARGVTFDNFYVASPVCQPNRATLATGRMPSLHGVRINGISLSLTANTFIEMLRAQRLAHGADRQEPSAEFRRRAAVRKEAGDARRLRRAAQGTRRGRQGRSRRPDLRPGERQELRRQSGARPSAALLRLRSRRAVLAACHARARALYAVAARAPSRRRQAARAGEPACPRLRAAAGLAHRAAGGALSDVLCGRAHARLSRRPRARRTAQAVLPAMLVSRSASSVHAAGPLLGHVQAVGHGAAGRVPYRQPAAAAARRPRCTPRATTARASPTRSRPLRSTSARPAKRSR